MQRRITRGAAANAGLIFHIFAQDSASTTGAGKASIAFSSWACRYIRNGEAISGAITPEDITTIGTYAAPTANTNIRIKAVDNTNMIGVYEVQLHLDWVNVTNNCQSLTIYLTATGVAVLPIQIPLGLLDTQLLQATPTNITAGVITTVTNLTNAPTAGDFTAAMKAATLARVTLVDTLTTYTGNAPQTGDNFAIVNGASGLVAIKTVDDAIKAKTDNLPSDPADASVIAGRFDTLDTSVADLPTNAELATALGTADDAILTQVALVKAKTDNLPSDPADESLIIAATDALAVLIGDVPTNSELTTALGTADDAVLTQVALVKTQTDKLTFTVANVLDANTLRVGGTVQTAGDLAALVAAVDDLVDTEVAAIKTVVDAVKVTTDKFVFTVANVVDANALRVGGTVQTAGDVPALLATIDDFIDTEIAALVAAAQTLTAAERNSIADAILARSLGTEAVSADNAVPTVAQAMFELLSLLGEFSVTGTTISCKKRDGTTVLFTSTLDSSSSPTSRTRAT